MSPNQFSFATSAIFSSGILYNFLDKPETINITGKGTIKILYDADGNKLQRTFTPTSGTAKVTTYINEFVYQGDTLQYINFEEGRIRVVTPVSTNNGYDGLAIDGNMDLPPSPAGVGGGRGAYDFFIRDYQQNVRMILTEETHYGINECTMETSRAANEEPIFGQAGSNNEVVQTRITTPSGWSSNTSAEVSKLSKLTGHTIGPNSLLKVMAGDVINATADYYYPAAVTNNHNSLVTDIVAGFVSAISGSAITPASVHGNTANISSDLNASAPFASIADPDSAATDNIPRAYLNVVFFNERFEFVNEGSTAVRVSQAGDGTHTLILPTNIKAPKNGYAYIYLSNENDDAVYFDNFTVSDTRNRIIEEDHYYAFGLKIAGISSKKLGDVNEGSLKNNYQYQGDYSEMDEDIGWNDFALRNYDSQVGRWMQEDPYNQYPSPYIGMGNNPVNNIDPNGGWAISGLFEGMSRAGIMATTTLGGAIVGSAIDLLSGGDGGKGLLIGAALGAGSNFGADLNIGLDIFRGATQIDNRIIRRTLNDLTDKLNDADRKLNRWKAKDKNDFSNHFGTKDNTAKSIIKERVKNEKDLILKYRKNNSYKQKFIRDPETDYAHSVADDPNHTVYLERLFWKAKRRGTNSKYGTVAHELSHFNDVGPTYDFSRRFYGPPGSQNLRDLHDGRVLNHADSFEYYIEHAW